MSIAEAGGSTARLALVEEHVRLENRHDLDGIMGTFGVSARYDEEPWDDHHIGREAVRAYYDALLRAMPDPCYRSEPAPRRRGCRSPGSYNQWTSSGRVARAAADSPVQFPLLAFSPSSPRIGWRARRFITTAPQCCISSAFSTSLTACRPHRAVVMHPLTMAQAFGRTILQRRSISTASSPALAIAWGRHGYKTVSLTDDIHFAFRTLPSYGPALIK